MSILHQSDSFIKVSAILIIHEQKIPQRNVTENQLKIGNIGRVCKAQLHSLQEVCRERKVSDYPVQMVEFVFGLFREIIIN